MANRGVQLMRACPALVYGWPRLSELPATNATDPALATLAAEG